MKIWRALPKEEALARLLCFMEETFLSSRVRMSSISLSSSFSFAARVCRAMLACFVSSRPSCSFGLWGCGVVNGAPVSTSMSMFGGAGAADEAFGSPGSSSVCLSGFSGFRCLRAFTSAAMPCSRGLSPKRGPPETWPLIECLVTGGIGHLV